MPYPRFIFRNTTRSVLFPSRGQLWLASAKRWCGALLFPRPVPPCNRLAQTMNTSLRFTDHLGVAVAAACSLHCLCMPILLTISTVAVTAEDLAKPTEYLLLASSFLLGSLNLTHSWLCRHRRLHCLGLFLAGFSLFAIRDHLPTEALTIVISLIGGFLVSLAHLRNLRLCRESPCCNPG